MEDHLEEYEALMKQFNDGLYDGDGPADATVVYQETGGDEEAYDGE